MKDGKVCQQNCIIKKPPIVKSPNKLLFIGFIYKKLVRNYFNLIYDRYHLEVMNDRYHLETLPFLNKLLM